MIRAESLVKRYGPFTAVDGVSFAVPRGQVVAFPGAERGGQDDDAPHARGGAFSR